MDYQKNILSNGLRLIMVPMEGVGSVTAMILMGAGSRYENKKNCGLSHFLEHMAFKGTKKRPTAREIATLIDGVGGEFNAFTGKEMTGFYVKSASQHLELTLDVLADMILNSKFTSEEIEKERGVILEEINLYEDTPSRKITDIYEELLYGDHPLGWDTAGKREVIRKIKREDFLNYLSSFYSPQNMVAVVAGSFNLQKVTKLMEKFFGKMRPFEPESYKKISENQEKPQVRVRYKKTEQAHLCLGVRTFPLADGRRWALAVLTAILGEGMSSRLFLEVRERRGLAYYVRSLGEHYLDCGTMFTQAGIELKKVEEGIKVIVGEYQKIKIKDQRSKIKDGELGKAKEYLKGHLVLELEDSRAVAGFFGTQELLEQKIKTPKEVIEKIEKVTVEDILAVGRQIFLPERLNLALIGPFRDRQRFEKLLNF